MYEISHKCRAVAQNGTKISASSKLGYFLHRQMVIHKNVVATDLGILTLQFDGVFHNLN